MITERDIVFVAVLVVAFAIVFYAASKMPPVEKKPSPAPDDGGWLNV